MEADYRIEHDNEEARIVTNAGTFHLSPELFAAYLENAHLKEYDYEQDWEQRSIGFILARATLPQSFPAREKELLNKWPTDDLDRKVVEWVARERIIPTDYLERDMATSRTGDIWNRLTPEIKDLMARERLFLYFSNNSTNEDLTWLEHKACGSSTGFFFGNPFMTGLEADPEWQEQARAGRDKRLEEISSAENSSALALYIYGSKAPPLPPDTSLKFREKSIGLRHFRSRYPSQDLNTQMKSSLAEVYSHAELENEAPAFDQVDHARVLLTPVPYDSHMMAIPEPLALEFCHGGKVVGTTKDPSVLDALRFRLEDLALADTLQLGDRKIHVGMTHKEFDHRLREIPATLDWYDTYVQRVAGELSGIVGGIK